MVIRKIITHPNQLIRLWHLGSQIFCSSHFTPPTYCMKITHDAKPKMITFVLNSRPCQCLYQERRFETVGSLPITVRKNLRKIISTFCTRANALHTHFLVIIFCCFIVSLLFDMGKQPQRKTTKYLGNQMRIINLLRYFLSISV